MIKTTTTISNKLGLHARASAKLTKLAGSFPCEVWMSRGERRVNAKSIMGIMMLAAGRASCRSTIRAAPSSPTRPCGRPSMIQSQIQISNKLGLHARASAKLTKLAGSFPCEVWMSRGERRVNAKSIMGVMMLAAGIGSDIEIETDGEDEAAALRALTTLIDDKFGEGE